MKHLLISILLSSFLLGIFPKSDFDSWNILQEGDIWIGNFEDDFPWCKAKIRLPYSITDILPVIEDVNNYHKMLDSVELFANIEQLKDEVENSDIFKNIDVYLTDKINQKLKDLGFPRLIENLEKEFKNDECSIDFET